MSRTLAPLIILVLAAALVPIASSAVPARAEPGLPPFCWVLDSPHADQISPGGETFLREACTPDSRSARPEPVEGRTTAQHGSTNTTPSGAVFFGSDVLVNDPGADTPPNTTQSEVTIVECGGTTLAAWNDSGSASSGTFTGYARSFDDGRTWADLGNIPGPTGSDPVLAADSDCRFYFAAIGQIDGCGAIGVVSSDNGGSSWGPVVNASPGLECSAFQDKEWMAVDTSGGSDDGNVYLCWDERAGAGVTVYFSRSTDRGQSFSDPIAISSFGSGSATGCQVQVDRDGRIYVVWTEGSDLSIRIRASDDGGESFESAMAVADTLRVGEFGFCGAGSQRPLLNGDIRAFNWPGFAIHPETGSLHVVWNDASIDGADIFYTRSSDGVGTWSDPVRINDDATQTDQFQPAIAFSGDGVLRALWLDRRLDPVDNEKIDAFSVASFDEGETFEPNERISDVSFGVPPVNPNFDPEVVSCYMGDYHGITGVADWHYMAWADNRNLVDGRPDPDVFFDKRSAAVVRVAVTRTDDPSPGVCLPSDCSLREAIVTANQTTGPAEIRVPAGNYALTISGVGEGAGLTGDLDISGDVIIYGDGANTTFVDAQGNDRVLEVHAGSVTISGLSIRGGFTVGVPDGVDANGPGVRNHASLVLDALSISGNLVDRSGSGGGVYNSGALLLRNSIVFSNGSVFDGGGVHNTGTMSVTNSTITDNVVAFSGGGGFGNTGSALLNNVTLSRNESGIVEGVEGNVRVINIENRLGSLDIVNSIVEGDAEFNCFGEIRSLGHNIENGDSCGFDAPGDLPNTDPLLASRGINGGPTLTIPISDASPALDAGDPAVCLLSDQRGFARPIDGDNEGGAVCDIGAFEFGSFPLGDVDCSLQTDVLDALDILQAVADLASPECVDLVGDANCDGAKDAGDALTVLRHLAALSLNRPADCPPFGFG
jgi:CSLREA domain-containing protein